MPEGRARAGLRDCTEVDFLKPLSQLLRRLITNRSELVEATVAILQQRCLAANRAIDSFDHLEQGDLRRRPNGLVPTDIIVVRAAVEAYKDRQVVPGESHE